MRASLLALALLLAACGAENLPAPAGLPELEPAPEATATSGSTSDGASSTSGSTGDELGASGSTGTTGSSGTTGSTDSSGSSGSTGSDGSSSGSSGSTGSSGGAYSDTWSTYAQGFFAANCEGCHYWASSYNAVASDASTIRTKIAGGDMPKDHSLAGSDKARILAWFDCGHLH
jgi:hypothetical protein